MEQNISRIKQFRPTEKSIKLSRYTAQKLNDIEMLPFYIACCNRYPESCIKKALTKTVKLGLKKVKKRRGNFFKQLLYEYAKTSYNNYRN